MHAGLQYQQPATVLPALYNVALLQLVNFFNSLLISSCMNDETQYGSSPLVLAPDCLVNRSYETWGLLFQQLCLSP